MALLPKCEAGIIGINILYALGFLEYSFSFYLYIIFAVVLWMTFCLCLYFELSWQQNKHFTNRTFFRPRAKPAFWTMLLFPITLFSLLTSSVLDTTAAMLILQAGLLLVQPLFLAGILWWSQAKDIQKICIKFSAIAGLLEIPLVFFMSFHVGIDFPASTSLVLMVFGHLYTLQGLIFFLPKTFTYGEVSLVSQMMVFFTYRSCSIILQAKQNLDLPDKDELMSTVMFCLMVAVVIFHFFPDPLNPSRFYGTYIGIGIVFAIYWFARLYPYNLQAIISNFDISVSKVCLLLYWCVWAGFAIKVVINYNTSKDPTTTIVRKYFHLVMVGVYFPGLLIDTQFLSLAASLAFAILLGLEQVRMYKVPPFGSLLHKSLSIFLDDKDTGPFFVTHIYLLIGFSVPVWLSATNAILHTHYVSAFAGFLSLGIGDSAASTFGSKFGKIKLSGTSKTFEGTLFSIIAQLIFVWYLSFMVHFPINLRLVFTIAITSLYEAFTDQIDNLVLPLLIFPFLNLL